ncbi:hypothetical protein [Streptomyces sp. NPDC015414]|uniref:hypothetical protein n=1 Tax=Streptomyces sp. NPDC015414 TaxID=3364957 RepID=UPI0036FD1157
MSEGNVVLAQQRGFRAGVRRAIGIVERALDPHGAPVYVRKEITHDHYIFSEPRKRGAVFVDGEAAARRPAARFPAPRRHSAPDGRRGVRGAADR